MRDAANRMEEFPLENDAENPRHVNHQGHEEAHSMILILLLVTIFLAQASLFLWKKKHSVSYQIVTLLGLWLVPIYMSLSMYFWRMILTWSVFSVITLLVIYRAQQKPLNVSTPRVVYQWFHTTYNLSYGSASLGYSMTVFSLFFFDSESIRYYGILMIFYGLYFGVLGRDCAELCAEQLRNTMGFSSKDGLPMKRLNINMCAICAEQLPPEDSPEKLVKLQCNHLYHDFCIRGWTLIGKKDVCPYCSEKVDMRSLYANPWTAPSVWWSQLLDFTRYMIVWNPLIFFVANRFALGLGLE